MRIGVFYSASYYLRFYESALVELAARGHDLILISPDNGRGGKLTRALRESSSVRSAFFPVVRGDGLGETAMLLRTIRDAARYSRPELRDATANRQRAHERLARLLGGDLDNVGRLLRAIEPVDETQRTVFDERLAGLEALLPPDPGIANAIESESLDVVVLISRINLGGAFDDVLKAARIAGVPSGLVVYSWDNLTNKGLIHVAPDRLFVWNDVQRSEASGLHGIDPASIEVTGAARFDAFFARSPSGSREAILAELELDPSRKTILYVGSSIFVAPREPEFVEAWLRAVRSSSGVVNRPNVMIRPHPGTLKDGTAWDGWAPLVETGAVVAPRILRNREQDLYDQLFASDAVVGLNTSAEIEAAILDKPVLTVEIGEPLAPGQVGSTHFRYLLEGEGGYVAKASTIAEHLEQLAASLTSDPLAAERRRFVRSFVRPSGLTSPAGSKLADGIERLARPGGRSSDSWLSRAARRLRSSSAPP